MYKRITGRLIAGVVSNLVLVSIASATSFYVRTGATGSNNGTDWDNAWSNMTSINQSLLRPGDIVYIAGGNYGRLGIDKSGAAGSPLVFKRATKNEHGTSIGWSDGYDARVIIDGGGAKSGIGIGEGVYASQSYITVDGVTRYGIWVKNAYYGVRAGYPAHNLTLRNLEIGDAGAGKLTEDGIQGLGNNLVVENSYIHDNDSNVTHGDNIQWFEGSGITLRYNVFKNGGQMFKLGEEDFSTTVSNVNIYYNVFYNRGGSHYNGMVFAAGTPQAGAAVNIFNNTFDLEATSDSGYNSVFYPLSGAGTVNFKNNAVLYSNGNQIPNTSHSNNGYDNSGSLIAYNIPSTESGRVVAGDLGFVNVSAADYHLAAGSPLIGKGVNVGLTKDFDGKPVPSTPSIGAFEAGSASSVVVAPPSGLTVK
jgi:hypothetical protein